MNRWHEPQGITVAAEFAAQVGGHPFLAETLWRRGIRDVEAARRFLNPDRYHPASADDLPDMQKAVDRIFVAIDRSETICVWGDFDVDGQTSTALLVSALTNLGADVTYYIPHRETEGHGVHIPRLSAILNEGVQLILTCDTGIAAHTAVDFARSQSVDTIITDHHQLPAELPNAVAAVNPQRLKAGHPLRTLPGVGCAYKLVEALYRHVGLLDDVSQYLDLVALGIVADVAEVIGDTRYLLQRGLGILRQTQRLGLVTMIEQANIVQARIDVETIGFALAPRLNALGRLDDANVAVELLTTSNVERARILVNRLEGLNAQRKLISDQVFQAAQQQIEQDPTLLNYAALVLSHEKWPGGIIGIVANRLVELYNRPVILLSTPPDDFARGSARSVAGLDITAAIAANADFLNSYGGHTMAAGLSLLPQHIPDFRRGISRTVTEMLGTVDTTPTLTIEAFLSLADIHEGLLDALEQLSPFGPGNPAPVLATQRLTLNTQRTVGRTGEHLRLTVEDEQGTTKDLLWWRADPDQLPPGRFDAAYTVQANDYQGRREIQLQLVDIRPVDEEPLDFRQRATIEIVDWREDADPEHSIQQLHDTLVWAEGKHIPNPQCVTRHDLRPAASLAIWTTPPGADELRAALDAVNPAKVYLFAVNPGTDAVQAFLQHFGGLVKHVLGTSDGKTSIAALAAAGAHRESTVRAAIDWLAARGHVRVVREEEGTIWLAPADQPSGEDQTKTTARLASLLQETAAYRGYFRRTDAKLLLGV